jgi:hypothetical protein
VIYGNLKVEESTDDDYDGEDDKKKKSLPKYKLKVLSEYKVSNLIMKFDLLGWFWDDKGKKQPCCVEIFHRQAR